MKRERALRGGKSFYNNRGCNTRPLHHREMIGKARRRKWNLNWGGGVEKVVGGDIWKGPAAQCSHYDLCWKCYSERGIIGWNVLQIISLEQTSQAWNDWANQEATSEHWTRVNGGFNYLAVYYRWSYYEDNYESVFLLEPCLINLHNSNFIICLGIMLASGIWFDCILS